MSANRVVPNGPAAYPGLVKAFYEPNANARTALSYYGPGYDGPGGDLEKRAMRALKNRFGGSMVTVDGARLEGNAEEDTADTSFRYVPLPHSQMVEIRQFYHSQALIVDAAEKILNFYTFGDEGEIRATYGGRPVPERQNKQVNIALATLLPMLRAWRHMFGFIAVRDPGGVLDEARAELDAQYTDREEVDAEADVLRAADTARREDPVDEAVRESIDQMAAIFGSAGAAMRDDIMTRIVNRDDDEDNDGGVRSPVDAFALLDRTRSLSRSRRRTPARRQPRSDTDSDVDTDDEFGVRVTATAVDETTRSTRSTPAARARRTLSEAIASMQRFVVMTLSDGRFFIEHDRLTDERRVVFASNRDNEKLYSEFDRYGEAPKWARDNENDLTEVVVDRSVMVYVWPDMMPLHDGQLASKMGEVLRLRNIYAQAEAYVMRSNAARANPLQLYITQPDKPINSSFSELTDQQLFVGGSAEQTQRELRDAVAEGRRRERADARLHIDNGRLKDEITRRLAAMHDRPGSVGSTGIRVPDAPADHHYLLLPEGIVPSNSVVQPTTDLNVGELKNQYEQALASIVGIPLTMLRAGGTYSRISGSSGGGASTGSASLTMRALLIAVRNDRDLLAQGVAGLYDLAFRSIDNETISAALGSLQVVGRERGSRLQAEIEQTRKKIETLTDITERQLQLQRVEQRKLAVQTLARRIDLLTKDLVSIAAHTFRFQVHFRRLLHVPLEDISFAYEQNALSKFEFVNLLRARINLPSFDSIEQWTQTIEKEAAPNSEPFAAEPMASDAATSKRKRQSEDEDYSASNVPQKKAKGEDANGS